MKFSHFANFTRSWKPLLSGLGLTLSGVFSAQSQDLTESDYYTLTKIPTPEGVGLEVSSIELLPESRLALGTRRGDIWVVSGADSDNPADVSYQLFAEGLHEVMGLAWKDGSLFVTNRYEVAELRDKDGDGRADMFRTICDKWGVSGDYHEYAFGSRFDKEGNIWVTLCLTGSFSSEAPFRGWTVKVAPDGTMTPVCSGIRSPGGILADENGEVYYTDNQGPWHGSCTLQRLIPGSFQGHPGGFVWYDQAPEMGPRPVEPNTKSRMVTERKRIKELVPPVVYMVHGKIGQSSSAIVRDTSEGKFGPFAGQLFVADQCFSNVARVFIETVNGVEQGVVFPFREGFASGPIGARMDEAGRLFVGGSDRGWGARGGQPFSFEKLTWTGKTPPEIKEIRAKPDGFELTFTTPADPKTASDPASYSARAFTYIYQSDYGSPEVDEVKPEIRGVTLSEDRLSVKLVLSELTQGHIHEIHADGVRTAEGAKLLHPVGYYTLNEIPAS